MSVAIKVEGLSKSYKIGEQTAYSYRSFRDVLANAFKFKKNKSSKPEFWALKDVSFEVEQGEVVGIIGRNGAGKSTLLKILSRITEPTEGYAEIHGRVGSLLEVGTGFHPELTGRENIYLNGSILGMKRREIAKKFDEIVDFAEVEKFIDTPVKHYSSGMYVRLAFAVAAHLEPEILVVDEVLAVGDIAFQKKCLGKMSDVSKEGRTVLFVSHNVALIIQLCNKIIWLYEGKIKKIGDPDKVTSEYLLDNSDRAGIVRFAPEQQQVFSFEKLALYNKQGQLTSHFQVDEPITINLEYKLKETIEHLELSLRIYNALGAAIFTTHRSTSVSTPVLKGRHHAEIVVPASFLAPNSYVITLIAHVPNKKYYEKLEEIIMFDIEETGSDMAIYHGKSYGVILVNIPWEESDLS